ncbi:MAG: raffinose/stachyose/melibiose transport system permease protein [Thermomicrobiales bacterium]|jgi:raffinose/stachyose/melibiose transport system permease protein|nr:raffinose/stachyose/melibiose transport system permease protein [Thermomicrobiales bacterium]MEA2593635.1 raffinose/stachyose/melibiose transport system permease protein [Thermomicrobiales bacterium]
MPAQQAPELDQREQRSPGGPWPARADSAAARSGAAGESLDRPGRRFWERRPYIWFILPALLAYGGLFIYPTVRAFYLSLFDWSGIGPVGEPVWLANFWELLRNDRFQHAAWNSTKLFAVIFVLQNTVSLGLAVMLNRRSRMTHIYRVIIFLPVIMSAVATGIIWVLMLDPIIGIVNPVLHDIGLGSLQREWQADQSWAMKTVYLVQFWQWNGMAVVLYLAGLQNVPEDLRHAALVDGARRWQVFRDVTFPMLAPAFTIVTALSFILIFRAFDLIYVLGGATGAPDGATLVIGVLIYGDAFGTSSFSAATRMSYAMAEGVTLFVFLAGVSGLLIRILGTREEAIS